MRLIVARCSVRYTGRLETTLAEAVRLLMVKADGTFMVWADGGGPSVKPLNWMTPPTVIEESPAGDGTANTIVVRKRTGSSEDRLEILISDVLSDSEHEMGSPAEHVGLAKDGVEADLQALLAERPDQCGEGLRLVRREWPTDIGPVDLMCRDAQERWVAVEIKRVAGIDAVEQLTRYLERIRCDPAFGSCRGVLAAQAIRPQARVLAQARAIDCVEVDLAVLRGEREPELKLFGMNDEQAVLPDRRGRVLVITINRPGQRNAVNAAVAAGIAAALEELDGDPELSLAVITGAGKGFSAGMDLKAFVAGERGYAGDRGFAGIVQRPPEKPLIAAVEGFAVAGGLEIALACDLIVASRGARLGIPEVKRSLVAAGGALLRLPRTLPRNVAMELALTGDPIDAERGYELGLVNRLAEPGEALSTALELAETIAANGPLALAATKRVMNESTDWPDSDFFERQAEIVTPVMTSEDAREGATAFAEKRSPVWKAR